MERDHRPRAVGGRTICAPVASPVERRKSLSSAIVSMDAAQRRIIMAGSLFLEGPMRAWIAFFLILFAIVRTPSAFAEPVVATKTFYYDGDRQSAQYSSPAIDVDGDGTVAVALNTSIGPMNAPGTSDRWVVLLYDKAGEPIGRIISPNSQMIDVCFGPDGRVYTAEGWFGSGVHIYDRPGVKERWIPKRKLTAKDLFHPDKGASATVAVSPDFRIFTVYTRDHELRVLDVEDNVVENHGQVGGKVFVTPAGQVYTDSQYYDAQEKAWKKLSRPIIDVDARGRLLVSMGNNQWGVFDSAATPDPAGEPLLTGVFPQGFSIADMALGPDDRLYCVLRDPRLAYIVADAEGNVVLRRGADFEQITVTLPSATLTSGEAVELSAEMVASRELGYVPDAVQLPLDNRPRLALHAFISPAAYDLLEDRTWTACALEQTGDTTYRLTLPPDALGEQVLRFQTSAPMPGREALAVEMPVTVQTKDAAAVLTPRTDRARIAHVGGQPMRITVPIAAHRDIDLSKARLALQQDGRTVAAAPLGVGSIAKDARATAVVVFPAEVTARLRPGRYAAQVIDAPEGVVCGASPIRIVSPVRPTLFETLLHPIGPGYHDSINDPKVYATLGATHIVNPGAWDGRYLDMLTALGITMHYQPVTHYQPVNALSGEAGALKVAMAGFAQRMKPYPAFRGFNYHDLQTQPYGGWGDMRRQAYRPMWDELAKEAPIPDTVPADKRPAWAEGWAVQEMLNRAYAAMGEGIAAVDPTLDRTTMEWLPQPLYVADPDHIAQHLTMMATQNMEEQFYHPITVAYQTDVWRRPGMALWNYGDTTWQEDGTGASMFTGFMAALMRGAQGVGRNELPRFNDRRSEVIHRTMAPAFRLMHRYGGLSAASEPEDQIAVWRSFYSEMVDAEPQYPGRRHPYHTQHHHICAAFAACMYAHRPATLITDERVRSGELSKYKAVIVNFEMPLPPDLLEPLTAFQKSGGIVLAHRSKGGYWAPEGAIELGSVLEDVIGRNLDSDRHAGVRDRSIKEAKIIVDALGDKIVPMVDCDEPTTWLSVLRSGEARYIFATNVKLLPHPPMDLHRFSGYENTRMPTRTPLRLRDDLRGMAIYDVLAGKRVEPDENGEIVADFSIFPGAIFALVPKPVESIELQGAASAERDALHLRVSVNDADQSPIAAAVPLEVRVIDPAGSVRYALYRTATGGVWEEALPLAANDPAGAWRIEVAELLAQKRVGGRIELQPPAMPDAAPAPAVERTQAKRIAGALKAAKRIAIVVTDEQRTALSEALAALEQRLAKDGRKVTLVAAAEYLADLKTFGWEGFGISVFRNPEIRLRPKRYDLIVAIELPEMSSGVVAPDLSPCAITPTDPGPGRGLVQYVVMPVYDTEDAISLAAGDAAGLMRAIEALDAPPAEPAPAPPEKLALATLPPLDPPAATDRAPLRELIGIPAAELAVSPDGSRILVGLKGWGDNLITLGGDGKIVSKQVGGKHFPLDLRALDSGFAYLQHENDSTTLYLKMLDTDGTPVRRIASPGRRIGGVRDWSPTQPEVIAHFLNQTSFDLTPDARFAAAVGTKAAAVFDLSDGSVLWRDDSVRHDGSTYIADAGAFTQTKISPDGARLAQQRRGNLRIIDLKTGDVIVETNLPTGAAFGRIRHFDGDTLVTGEREFFALRGGKMLWHFKPPKDVSAAAFAPDGEHYATGELDGAVRLMHGGRQIAGWLSPAGGMVTALDISPDGQSVAFATVTGYAGVLRGDGSTAWQAEIGARASIRFIGNAGETILSDWRGGVRRMDASGKEIWCIDLAPEVWRDDAAEHLTRLDDTSALRLPAPESDRPHALPPAGAENLARQATITHIKSRSWWNIPFDPERSVPLNDGDPAPPPGGWYDLINLEYVSFIPSPPAWELQWERPQTIDCVVIHESPDHPSAVPAEIKIEAWLDDGWKEIVHTHWNQGTPHAHRFEPVTTTKLRYTPIGDLAGNVWIGEIEVYGPDAKAE
jgi:WD40 repeat protein